QKSKFSSIHFSVALIDADSKVKALPGFEFLYMPDISSISLLNENDYFIIKPEEFTGKEYVRGYALLSLTNKSGDGYVLIITHAVPNQVTRSLSELLNAVDEYEEFKSYRRPLASSYFLTLVVVTLLVVFAAISVGFFLARSLAV